MSSFTSASGGLGASTGFGGGGARVDGLFRGSVGGMGGGVYERGGAVGTTAGLDITTSTFTFLAAPDVGSMHERFRLSRTMMPRRRDGRDSSKPK